MKKRIWVVEIWEHDSSLGQIIKFESYMPIWMIKLTLKLVFNRVWLSGELRSRPTLITLTTEMNEKYGLELAIWKAPEHKD